MNAEGGKAGNPAAPWAGDRTASACPLRADFPNPLSKRQHGFPHERQAPLLRPSRQRCLALKAVSASGLPGPGDGHSVRLPSLPLQVSAVCRSLFRSTEPAFGALSSVNSCTSTPTGHQDLSLPSAVCPSHCHWHGLS